MKKLLEGFAPLTLDVTAMLADNIKRAGGQLPDQVRETLLTTGAMTQEQIDKAERLSKEND